MTHKYGKLPARPGSVQLKMSDYVKPRQLPKPPPNFGDDRLITEWDVLANDSIGDCVIAGGAHETMLWTAVGGRPCRFSDYSVTADYSAITGYSRWKPWSDNGTDIQEAAKYRQRKGLRDKWGVHHKIGAYVLIEKGNIEQHALAVYLFKAIGIGVACPVTMMEQFDNYQPWTVVPGSKTDGFHYIPIVNRRNGLFGCVSWGRVQPATMEWVEAYEDEAIAYVSPEMLTGKVEVDGLDYQRLLSDLQQVQRKEKANV